MDPHTHGVVLRLEYDFPLWGSPYGYPHMDPHMDIHMGISIWRSIWGFPQKSCGNGMGVGVEIPFPRQPTSLHITMFEFISIFLNYFFQNSMPLLGICLFVEKCNLSENRSFVEIPTHDKVEIPCWFN